MVTSKTFNIQKGKEKVLDNYIIWPLEVLAYFIHHQKGWQGCRCESHKFKTCKRGRKLYENKS